MDDPLRVVLADDSALLREAVGDVLGRAGMLVRTRAATVQELVAAVDAERPDVAVLDIRFPPAFRTEGLVAALELRERHRGLPVVMLSQHVVARYAVQLLSTGAGVGYLLKDRAASVDDFVGAVREVAAGGCVVDAEVSRALLGPAKAKGSLDGLTPRELEVLALMARGCSNRGIGVALHLSERTVEVHMTHLMRTLDLPDDERLNRRVLAVLRYLDRPAATDPH